MLWSHPWRVHSAASLRVSSGVDLRLVLGAHAADQVELGLEVDIVRQLQMLDEAGRLDIVGVRDDEFLVLRGGGDVLAELARAQRPVAERHRHRLALGLAEHQPVAAGELRRRLGRALELVDHLAFGDADAAERAPGNRSSGTSSSTSTSPMRISPTKGWLRA